MTISITHLKTNAIADWTQEQLDAAISKGQYAAGTTLSDIVLPSDWNDEHTITGVQETLPDFTAGQILFGDGDNVPAASDKFTYLSGILNLKGKIQITADNAITSKNTYQIYQDVDQQNPATNALYFKPSADFHRIYFGDSLSNRAVLNLKNTLSIENHPTFFTSDIMTWGVSGSGSSHTIGRVINDVIYSSSGPTGDHIFYSLGNGTYTGYTGQIKRLTIKGNTGNLLLGATTDSGRLTVSGAGATSSTKSVSVHNSTGSSNSLNINDAGQSVFGGPTPDASAKVQIDSTTQGFLPPRMTTTQINAISNPSEGLVVYNTTVSGLCVYAGSSWRKLNDSPM